MTGPQLFTRYAYPPNELGYCGPDDHLSLLEYGAAGVADPGLRQLAQAFDGAWPYLELIAHAVGKDDPLDRDVVEAYWIGNRLLEQVQMATFGESLMERFRARMPQWSHLAETIPAGAVPHHSFHVFCVYPWVGLLRDGSVEEPLRVLDRCRIRWGVVTAVDATLATVRSRALAWDGRRLSLGSLREERAVYTADGLGFVRPRVGDRVALHWDWVCDVLTDGQLASLVKWTGHHLRLVNEAVDHPAPRAILS